ncbi:MAG TPA: TldD/PmbA family protein [Gemmatimonadaceae bacterium]|jgi:TldD protein|nr:TldD/PmbA family protein [Gemmatimonadaceae bacterium]
MAPGVSRRAWLARQTALWGAASPRWRWGLDAPRRVTRGGHGPSVGTTAERVDPGPMQVLALRAVEAARSAGATYADARLTREVMHVFDMQGVGGRVFQVREEIGVGVRALVDGAWGFASSFYWDPDAVVRMARDAVAQAKDNATGAAGTVELGQVPVVTGRWETPIGIDPFTIPIEEKFAAFVEWKVCAERAGCPIEGGGSYNTLTFIRQERVLATSEGTLVTQTLHRSGGDIRCTLGGHRGLEAFLPCDTPAGQGWERFAQIPAQVDAMHDALQAQAAIEDRGRPVDAGRTTVVCDGATMAALLGCTLGIATQLDRALGYEANAGGTSFLDDPLAMVGHLPLASPLVTVTANRTAPTQLATVQWDDEGVVPQPFTLVKDGVLVDFQTTREQAAWLAPYYQSHDWPVHSNGCAAAQDANCIPMQMLPNLSLEPSASAIGLEDLVKDVETGLLIENGFAGCDFQARTGRLWVPDRDWVGVNMRKITKGVVGERLHGGSILFATRDLWTHVVAVGGETTVGGQAYSDWIESGSSNSPPDKGEPAQATPFSVRAAAATITNQPVTTA